MKIHLLISTILATLLAGFTLAESTLPDAGAHYREGVTAGQAGDPDAARAPCQRALRINPRHADAGFRLGQPGQRLDTIVRHGREAGLSDVMLPEIRLNEAGLRESLDALANLIEEHSDDQAAPNFVIQDPEGKLANASITLQLRNVSASAALGYIVDMADARARQDQFAIVIRPK